MFACINIYVGYAVLLLLPYRIDMECFSIGGHDLTEGGICAVGGVADTVRPAEEGVTDTLEGIFTQNAGIEDITGFFFRRAVIGVEGNLRGILRPFCVIGLIPRRALFNLGNGNSAEACALIPTAKGKANA